MKRITLYIGLIVLTVSCELNQKDVNPTDDFVKVYNHPNEAEAYYATSIMQVSDGYLILTGLKEQGLYNVYPKAVILKTDELGVLTHTHQTNWVAGAPKIVKLGNQVGFVAMDNQLGGHFISINPSTGEELESTPLPEISRPIVADIVNDNLVVLGYLNRTSIVALYNSGLTLINSNQLGTGNEYSTELDFHLQKTGYEFPFFIGEYTTESESGFFVNCLSNSSLSINFFNSNGVSTDGYIYEHQALFAAPSSLLHKQGNQFALTRYTAGKNYILPTIDVDINDIERYSDSVETPIYELPEKAKILSKIISFGGVEYMAFTSVTNSKKIVTYLYNLDSDELAYTHYIPFTENTEVVDIIQDTNDEGIVILGRTYVTGKYIRPLVVKVSKKKFFPEED